MKITNILSCLSLSALIVLPIAQADAAVPVSTPSSADAGRVEKNIQQAQQTMSRSNSTKLTNISNNLHYNKSLKTSASNTNLNNIIEK